MFLTEYRPTSPARRWEKRISTFYCKNIAQKKFKNKVNFKRVELKKVKRKRIFGTSTGVYKCSNYNTLYDGIHYVTNVFKVSYSNYLMASIAISGGVRKNQKLAYGYDIEVCHLKKKKMFQVDKPGFAGMPLFLYEVYSGAKVFSVQPARKNRWSFAEAAGTFCKILWHNERLWYTAMRIPSKLFLRIKYTARASLGRVSNTFLKYGTLGNARAGIKKKKNILSVRGVARNPVDHPNGGRANTKQPLKNPWGRIAKKSKTCL